MKMGHGNITSKRIRQTFGSVNSHIRSWIVSLWVKQVCLHVIVVWLFLIWYTRTKTHCGWFCLSLVVQNRVSYFKSLLPPVPPLSVAWVSDENLLSAKQTCEHKLVVIPINSTELTLAIQLTELTCRSRSISASNLLSCNALSISLAHLHCTCNCMVLEYPSFNVWSTCSGWPTELFN